MCDKELRVDARRLPGLESGVIGEASGTSRRESGAKCVMKENPEKPLEEGRNRQAVILEDLYKLN